VVVVLSFCDVSVADSAREASEMEKSQVLASTKKAALFKTRAASIFFTLNRVLELFNWTSGSSEAGSKNEKQTDL